jgi:hypothetical protein
MLSGETLGALKSFFHLSVSIFRAGPFVTNRATRQAQQFDVLESRFGGLVFLATKPQGRISPTQSVLVWVSPGGFRRP